MLLRMVKRLIERERDRTIPFSLDESLRIVCVCVM